MISEGYDQVIISIAGLQSILKILQAGSSAYAVPAREGHLVFVTSEDQIREVETSPIDHLSFHQAMEDRLKVKHTFAGFEMGPIDPHDAIPIRVLKTLLRADIPQLRPRIQAAIENAFNTCMNDGKVASEGWKPINTYHFSEEISLQVNCKIIFGERLTANLDFFQATRKYHRQALFAMLTSHYFPHWTHRGKEENSISVQRKVLKDFTFKDGTHVPAGNVICVPQQAVMRDPKYYDQPDEFLPFRFATKESNDAIQKFTDLKPHFYLWGATAKPCPGRWYASAVMQQFFVHLLTKYNFKLANSKAQLTYTYTTIVFPRPGIEILLQER
ncbi:MAG: hypothetical protein Q9182_002789 [Xanthomendoza sp. 2 TL-2023]